MKIIQKKFQGIIPENKILDTFSESQTDTYSCNKINKLVENIDVDLTEYIQKDELKTINGNSLIGEGDITIEGGSGSEIISLEEQVIGTDKDGKTLYKKTILATVNTETAIKYEDSNIYRVVDFNAIAYNDANTLKLPHFMIEPDGTIPYTQAWCNKWNGSTRLYARCSSHYTGYTLEATIKYTKITD